MVKKIQPTGVTPSQVVEEIGRIPDLITTEPSADLDFARRYAALSERLNMGVNVALLLQFMIDAGISKLFSYDQKFLDRAGTVNVEAVT